MSPEQAAEPGAVAWLIKHGWEVYDRDGEQVGDVEDVLHNHLVVGRGFLFTAARYIPVSAIRDVRDGRVYLNVTKDEIEARGWDVEPVVDTGATAASAGSTPVTAGDVTTMASGGAVPSETAGSTSRAKTWDDVEAGYRFGYDLAGDPRYRGRDWDAIQEDAQRVWASRHPAKRWDAVEAEVRSAWENASRG